MLRAAGLHTTEGVHVDPRFSSARSSAPRADGKPAGAVALRVDGLEKRYGRTVALAGLSFEVHAGEVFGLLGPNGAGKTTVISILATERRPSGGDAMLFEHSIPGEASVVRRLIGVVPQDVALYPMLTAAENLAFFGRIYSVERGQLKPRSDELLQFVGLEGRRDHYVNTFSGGMKRRLNLAVALMHRPKLLLLDEPTVGVDPQSREQIFDIVRRLRQAGMAILYATHHMEEAERLCNRLGIVSQGRLVATGTLDSLVADLECTQTIELHGLPHGTDLSAVRAIDGLCLIESADGVTRLFVKNAARFLEPLHKIIGRSRQPVRIKIAPMSLEHVFLRLTDKEFPQ